MNEVRIAVHGAKGRMGRRIVACAAAEPAVRVVAELDLGDDERWTNGPDQADLIIDFSSDAGAQSVARAALAKRSALLVGTTGLSPATTAALREASKTIPVLIAPNTSLGVAVARHLVREAARLLGDGYDAGIVERHHHHKKDAPSGTALALAQASADGGKPVSADAIHAQRLGDIIGEHVVTYAGAGEYLEIRHVATSRDLFALGALRMGVWLARRGPGWHDVDAWLAQRPSSGSDPTVPGGTGGGAQA